MVVRCDKCPYTAKFKCMVKRPGCKFSAKYYSAWAEHVRVHDPDPQVRRPYPCSFPGCDFRGSTKARVMCSNTFVHGTARTEPGNLCVRSAQNHFTLQLAWMNIWMRSIHQWKCLPLWKMQLPHSVLRQHESSHETEARDGTSEMVWMRNVWISGESKKHHKHTHHEYAQCR